VGRLNGGEIKWGGDYMPEALFVNARFNDQRASQTLFKK